jgi:hypothetical protein
LIEHGSHDELMRIDGTYARLVRIQTQVARNKKFEAALNCVSLEKLEPADEQQSDEIATGKHGPQWLDAYIATPQSGPRQTLEVILGDDRTHRGVFAVQCFPASRPDEFISLRTWERDGREHEVGMIRQLADWSPGIQALIRTSLSRRYLLRRIVAIDEIKLEHGYLNSRIQSNQGPAAFTMRWTQTQVQDTWRARQSPGGSRRQSISRSELRRIAARSAGTLSTIRLLVIARPAVVASEGFLQQLCSAARCRGTQIVSYGVDVLRKVELALRAVDEMQRNLRHAPLLTHSLIGIVRRRRDAKVDPLHQVHVDANQA